MTAIQTTSPRFRIKEVSSLVVRALLALAFVGAGIFSGHSAAVAEFNQVGFEHVIRSFTASLEIAGVVMLLWPRTITLGALLMGTVSAGAFVAQSIALHGDVVHTIVLGLILAAIAWRYRAQLLLVR